MFLKNKPGDVIKLTVYDCFSGYVRLLKKGRRKIYIETIDVRACYPCQSEPTPGECMWVTYDLICKDPTKFSLAMERIGWKCIKLKKSIKRLFKKDMQEGKLPF